MTLTAAIAAVPVLAAPLLMADVVADGTTLQVVLLIATGLFAFLTGIAKLKFDKDTALLKQSASACDEDRVKLRAWNEDQQRQLNQQRQEREQDRLELAALRRRMDDRSGDLRSLPTGD